MTDFRQTSGKRSRGEGPQTGFIFGDDEVDASAQLLNMDPAAPVDTDGGLTMTVKLRHGYEYIRQDDPNRCSDQSADAVNTGAFIAGAGGAAGTAAAIGAVPIVGARLVSVGVLAAGGFSSIGKGYLDEFTGGFQFSVRVRARKKGGDQWYQLGHALPCVPSAGVVGDAKRDAQFSVYSPPKTGDWEVEVIMETYKGEELNRVTREVSVEESHSGTDGSESGSDFSKWALDNPAKAGAGVLGSLVVTRAVIDNTLGGG